MKAHLDNSLQQKAVKLAKYDGWRQHVAEVDWYYHHQHCRHDAQNLLESYASDLNYLMPVCAKVLKELRPNRYFAITAHAITYLEIKILELNCDQNGQYSELFEACYQAIKLLSDEQ